MLTSRAEPFNKPNNLNRSLSPIEKETPALYKAGVSFSIGLRLLFKLFGLLKGSALEVSISLVEDLDPVTGNLGYK